MAQYLLVDDRDGSVLAEFGSPEQVVRMLARLASFPHGDPQVRLVVLDHQQGSLTDIASTVSMRPLAPLMERDARVNSRDGSVARRPDRGHR